MKGSVFIIIMLASCQLLGQNVIFTWARQMGGTTYDAAHAVVHDNLGNVYTTGQFTGTADFDPGPGVNMLTSYGGADVFVTRFDAAGNFTWAIQMGGTENDWGSSIAIDLSGNLYITGTFSGTADFDPGAGNYLLTSFGAYDVFVCKMNTGGLHTWTRQMGGTENDVSATITTDASGNVFSTGIFYGTADFDPGAGVFNLTNSGVYDNYVSKLDGNGNFLWALIAGGDGEGVPSVAVDNTGNAYVGGAFGGTYDFDPGPGINNLSSGGGTDIFASKYSPGGNLIWARKMSGVSYENGYAIAVSPAGNVFITGDFLETVDFDPGPGIYNLTSSGNYDVFICKLTTNGDFAWARRLGGLGIEQGLSITTDAVENVYTAGNFREPADFDPSACEYELSPATNGFDDIFVSKLDINGDFLWAKGMGGPGTDYAFCISRLSTGPIYTAGVFSQVADFDPAPGIYNLTSFGDADAFVHKLSPCTNSTSSTLTQTSCGPYFLNCRTYTMSGIYTQVIQNAMGCDSVITLNLTIGPITGTAMSASACSSYTWNGQTYSLSGNYSDTLVAANGCDSIVTLQLTILGIRTDSITRSICNGQQYEGYTSSGIYIDTLVAANGCDSIRTLFLTVVNAPTPDLGPDKGICPGDTLLLSPGVFSSYAWQDGSTGNSISVTQPGAYSVIVTNNCGTGTDEIFVTDGICTIWFPSAFSPNNDGRNDTFRSLGKVNPDEYRLLVYNRWGQMVFSTNNPAKGWDGTLNGKKQDAGVYVWFCTFKSINNSESVEMKGTILLIR